MKKILLLTILSASLFTSCTKEGCIDSDAINYDIEAKKDDGSCEYKDLSYCNDLILTAVFIDAQTPGYVSEIQAVNGTSNALHFTGIINSTYPITIDITNISINDIGSYNLSNYPKASIRLTNTQDNITYTTNHIAVFNNSNPITPGGTFIISNYDTDCNSISGSFDIEAWGASFMLNRDVKYIIKGEFNNFILDGQPHSL